MRPDNSSPAASLDSVRKKQWSVQICGILGVFRWCNYASHSVAGDGLSDGIFISMVPRMFAPRHSLLLESLADLQTTYCHVHVHGGAFGEQQKQQGDK